ncbi:excinuclease ABC subunit C [Fluviicoccus keumensis]|uniref:UvrABC system protein C n=1 Tax=Fluviicoccus keumensis TaxID=1435465 RepID=A0A4Q7Z6F1_9GAMM|nr:excinuclease ABC subunit UvrC [Fluviicoccus keumensis]RZU45229.1 excinuclease ABC subunit C [Fluviicoccus keumensis]
MSDFPERISAILATLPHKPGVYRMLGADAEILYVGKAKSLKSRVSSYFNKNITHPKTRALVSRIADIELTITSSEIEALLLEQTLIKTHKPPYNILLRDDKSYPYIFLSADSPYPRLGWRRGRHEKGGRVFGPYPGAKAVYETLELLQRVFMVRQCDENTFRNRDRPCLQYQIKRCRAPCVKLVSPEAYAEDVINTVRFLEGRNTELQQRLIERMENASSEWQFEQAALFRDQLSALKQIQARQAVYCEQGEADIFALAQQAGGLAVSVMFVRGGRVLGTKSYFPDSVEEEAAIVLADFIAGFYCQQERDLPEEILTDRDLGGEGDVIVAALQQQYGKRIQVRHRVRETRAAWLDLAHLNAEEALKARLANRLHLSARMAALQDALDLETPPARMECFDISHSQGEAMVASCVVFDSEGPRKRDYRQYLIKDITPGDDYAAMEQALTRRFSRKADDAVLPDILFIDGGKGQLAQAIRVLDLLDIDSVLLVGVAKGEGRKPGLETLHFADDRDPLQLPADHPGLHVIQHIRDEAHRFAITRHRAKRDKKRRESPLESIPGLGPKRRRDLLNHFGGLQELEKAGISDIQAVPGIGLALAETIYAALH